MLNDASGFKKVCLATGYTDLRRGMDFFSCTSGWTVEHSVGRVLQRKPLKSLPTNIVC